jgi:polar amino acid transport system substrate-binding protein
MKTIKPNFVISGFLILLLILPWSTHAGSRKITCTGHPDYKPFMWQHDNTLVGAGPELIRLIFKEMKKDFSITYVGPWARAQEMIQRDNVDFLVGAYNNAKRRRYMVYLDAYANDRTSVFVSLARQFPFHSRDDLIGKKGVTMHGDSFGDDLDVFVKEKLNIARVYDSASMFKRLLSGSMAYILWGDFPCEINAAMGGYKDSIIKLTPPLTVENMHMTVSKKSQFKDLVPAMNKIITRLKNSGKVQDTLTKYVNLYVTSQKVQTEKIKEDAVTIMIDGRLSDRENMVRMVSKRIWPKATTKSLPADPDYSRLLNKNTPLIYTLRRYVPKERQDQWVSVKGDHGFAFHKGFDENILALWRLSYEAMLNSGTTGAL